jgi:IclR family transcriptional regulator, acetate operon repressor
LYEPLLSEERVVMFLCVSDAKRTVKTSLDVGAIMPVHTISPEPPAQTMTETSTIRGSTDGADNGRQPQRLATMTEAPTAGRGVLDGAFAILEALAADDGGLALTALARASGLAKTSAYRLAEQLTALGAVQRVERRYYIGGRIGHYGQRWQPNPVLRAAGQAPVHTLAVQSRGTALLRTLQDGRLRTICTTGQHGRAYLPNPVDPDSTARTATGRVLYAAQLGTDDRALPGCWTLPEWRHLRTNIRDMHATVVDHQEAMPGVCCIAAPVWAPNRVCAGAVTVVVHAAKPSHNLRDLVLCAARSISARLS